MVNNITLTHPEIVLQWHHIKNKNLKPNQFTHGSHKIVWWICPNTTCSVLCIHEWQTSIIHRTEGKGCPFCSSPPKKICKHNSLKYKYPEIASQLHPIKNNKVNAEELHINSNKKYWWLCKNTCNKGCIHEWETRITNRIHNKSGCPYCSIPATRICEHNSLAYLYPEISNQWHPTRNGNLKPQDFSVCSGKSFWWLCDKKLKKNNK